MSDPTTQYIASRLLAEADRRKFEKLRKAGNSLAITVPKTWLQQLGLKEGDYVLLEKIFDKIVLQKARTEAL
jgi:AbrB family looped-hinge helix DNA binding protein